MPSAFLRHFLRQAGRRVLLSLLILAGVAVLEAAGLMLLMPLMELLGLGQIRAAGSLQGLWRKGFLSVGLTPSLEAVLGGFVALLILQAAARRLADHLNARIEARYTLHLRDHLYGAMIRTRWQDFTRLRAADVTRTLTQEVDQVGLAVQQAMLLAGVIGMALVQVGVAAALSPPLTALALGCGLLVALGLRPLNRRVQAAAQASQRHRSEMTAAIAEHLAGFKIAKSHGRGEHHQAIFTRVTHAIAEHFVAAHRTFSTTRTCFELAGWVALVAFLYAAVAWAALPTAQLVLMVFVFTRLMPRLVAIQTTWQRLLHYQNAFAVVGELQVKLDAASEPTTISSGPPVTLQREIRLENVTFRYDSGEGRAALDDVSLVIPARQMTALVGASGAGKSTLADLILGLLTPSAGRVLVDGIPIDGDRLGAWRQTIGYVPQEPFLFHDTVRANLIWAKPEATEEELRAVLRAAAAEDFVGRLPQGIDTVVGDRGVRLSGGERQRLTLARALLSRPTLLLLDEATSALDSENERFVQEAIEKLHGELTIVVIAHRLSTVRNADQVVVLDGGRVVESGGPKELVAREAGAFRRLMLLS